MIFITKCVGLEFALRNTKLNSKELSTLVEIDVGKHRLKLAFGYTEFSTFISSVSARENESQPRQMNMQQFGVLCIAN